MTDQNTRDLLERWAAIVLAITAITTSWAAYQANLWNGNQVVLLAEYQTNESDAQAAALKHRQREAMDATVVTHVVDALTRGEIKTVEFYIKRSRPEFSKALTEWLDADPLNNPEAPHHPLATKAYHEQVTMKAHQQTEMLKKASLEDFSMAQQAGSTADSYVFLTVLFSCVLFFSGISTAFRKQNLQYALLSLATVVLLGTSIALSFLPISIG